MDLEADDENWNLKKNILMCLVLVAGYIHVLRQRQLLNAIFALNACLCRTSILLLCRKSQVNSFYSRQVYFHLSSPYSINISSRLVGCETVIFKPLQIL